MRVLVALVVLVLDLVLVTGEKQDQLLVFSLSLEFDKNTQMVYKDLKLVKIITSHGRAGPVSAQTMFKDTGLGVGLLFYG